MQKSKSKKTDEKENPSSAKAKSDLAKATEGKRKVKSSGKGERFADMSADATIINEVKPDDAVGAIQESPATKTPRVRGKKYQSAKTKVDQTKAYSPKEAFELLKKISFAKKASTVELHLNVLEKGMAGSVSLPYSAGKTQKVVVFDEQIEKELKEGKVNFDILLASPAEMPKILPFAKLLGPRGLMPNPKNGTLVPDPKKALEKFSGNSLRYKTEKDFPLIHLVIGKVDQPVEELEENFKAVIKAVNPKNIKKAIIKSTMSPGIKVAL